MTEHTRTDGLPESVPRPDEADAGGALAAGFRSAPRNERMAADKIECNACPVLCQISAGKVGACDRYANQGGTLVRLDPVLVLQRQVAAEAPSGVVPFLGGDPAAASAPPAHVPKRPVNRCATCNRGSTRPCARNFSAAARNLNSSPVV